jgi:hypothetical protein
MRKTLLFTTLLVLGACVPAKKYNDLLEREKKCSEELEAFKRSSLDFEGKAKDFEARYNVIQASWGHNSVFFKFNTTKWLSKMNRWNKHLIA